MLHARATNIRCDRYCSNFLEIGVELNKACYLVYLFPRFCTQVGRSVASRTQTQRRDAAGAGDLAAAGGPRHHRRHRPLHHLPLIADLASSARSTTKHALRRRRRLLIST